MIPRQSSLPVIVLSLAGLVLTVAAGLMMFSTFMLYDDEGYVLFSLKNFAEHGHLYDTVYTQYGPLPYVLYAALHALGLPLTHVAGRLLTLLAWAGAAGLSTALVWRATKHFGAALATLAAVFVYLWIMVSEPNHPGALIAVLTAALGALGYGWLAADKTTRWAALAGAISAALILTKINVGVFAALSVLAFFLLHAASPTLRRFAPWLIAAGLAVLPFALMRALLGTPWVQTYALVFALAAVPAAGAAGLAAATEPRLRLGGREFIAALLGGVAISVVVLGVILARGTTFAEIIEGTLLGPLRHPTHFSLVFPWPAGTTAGAAVSLALFLFAIAARRKFPAIHHAVAALRFLASLALAAVLLRFPLYSPDNAVFAHALPFLWIFLWPLPGETSLTARTWLALLLLGQWLHPYPVPGSQIAWGTFLALPLAALGCVSAAGWLRKRLLVPADKIRLASQFVLILAALVTGSRLVQIGTRYLDSRPLGLPGAASLRLPDSTTATYRLLSLNAAAHADVLFSLPGMFSFNLWTDLPAPTLANVTHWFSLLDDAQQQAIIRALAAHPRSAVIVQAGHLDFLRARGLTPGGPLYDYVMREYTPAFTIDGFEFRVRRGRRIAPLLTAEVRERPAAANPSDPFNTLVEIPLLLSPGQKIASVEFAEMDSPASLHLDATNARLELTPITLQGDPATGSTGAALLRVYFNRADRRFSLARTLIILRDANGTELGLARLRP
ncbi:MAG: hypothetical protein JSS11_12810 [Verrucomicrobia bacterium]|nr:hypothetical protein [Verrucomicrobiota bacterium]